MMSPRRRAETEEYQGASEKASEKNQYVNYISLLKGDVLPDRQQ